jgi:hypothetical protein
MTAETPYPVTYKFPYEPYFLAPRTIPRCDVRFFGYGNDKVVLFLFFILFLFLFFSPTFSRHELSRGAVMSASLAMAMLTSFYFLFLVKKK